MKSFALLLVAGVALAQDLNSLPDCGKTCINNMLAIAQSQFGCAQGDTVCYCTQPRFGYGVRDCSNEACSDAADAAKAIQYGTQYCESIAASASQSGAAISTGALGILSSAAATATATGGSDQSTQTGTPTGGAAVSSAASSAASSAGESASSALSSLSASASSVASSLSSALSSAEASLSSQLASATNSAASRASSAAGSATGGAQSSGLAPKMTGVPVAGAIGIAAMLLI